MKRFWKSAEAVSSGDGWKIELDGKPVRTPARQVLAIPSEALGKAIAEEWNSIEVAVDPPKMPLNGLANAAIDRVAPDPQRFAEALAAYAESDLACYRAEFPKELAARQSESWDALLGWARRRFDVDFSVTCRVIHVEQPPPTLARLRHAVAALDAFHLAGLSPLVTIGGSLVAGLAVLEEAMTVDDSWAAVSIDDSWQLEQWGLDREAETALENRRRDYFAAARFLKLLDS